MMTELFSARCRPASVDRITKPARWALAPLGATLAMIAAAAEAAPRGSEFDNTLTPAGGGMEGVSVARAPDPVAALFGNPATMTQIRGRTEVSVGAGFVSPGLFAEGPALDIFGGPPASPETTLTGPFSSSSRNDLLAAPVATVLQRVGDRFVGGFGFAPASGLGGDFRNAPGLPNLISDLKLFAANFGGAYQVTDRLSVGAAFTFGIGSLEVGLTDSSGVVNDFGFGGTAGLTYDAGPLMFGAGYKAPLSVTYEQVLEVTPDGFEDLTLQQPQEVSFGFATTDALIENTYFAGDFRWKNYSASETYQDIWEDLFIGSVAVQHKLPVRFGTLALRGGYSYVSDLLKEEEDLGNSFGGFETVASPTGDGAVPVTPTFLNLAQATLANGYWRQSVSIGIGMELDSDGVLGNRMSADLFVNYGFDGDEQQGEIQSEGEILAVGMGLTFRF